MKWYAKYVGIPFRSLGRSKKGSDCYGLIRIVLSEEFNLDLPDIIGYDDSLNITETNKVIQENTPIITAEKVEAPEIGDIVYLANRGISSHVGVIVDKNIMLHTTKQTGAVIEYLTSDRIKRRIKGYYRVNQNYSTNKSV